eukprot:1136778-Pelagomonas_calceolata.AAC.3
MLLEERIRRLSANAHGEQAWLTWTQEVMIGWRSTTSNLYLPLAHASSRTLSPYLFPISFPRLTSSCPDAELFTSHHAILTSSKVLSFFLLLTPCVTQQAQQLTEDQHSYSH